MFRFESTYKELKQYELITIPIEKLCFESTYKELKQAPMKSLSFTEHYVLSLPIRN